MDCYDYASPDAQVNDMDEHDKQIRRQGAEDDVGEAAELIFVVDMLSKSDIEIITGTSLTENEYQLLVNDWGEGELFSQVRSVIEPWVREHVRKITTMLSGMRFEILEGGETGTFTYDELRAANLESMPDMIDWMKGAGIGNVAEFSPSSDVPVVKIRRVA